MEEEKIKKLFDDYEPELVPDSQFMSMLEKQFDTVESIKMQLAQHRWSQRLAMVAATVAGFILGVISTLCYPMIAEALHRAAATTSLEAVSFIDNYGDVTMGVVLCMLTLAVTYVVYDITLIVSGNLRSFRLPV